MKQANQSAKHTHGAKLWTTHARKFSDGFPFPETLDCEYDM